MAGAPVIPPPPGRIGGAKSQLSPHPRGVAPPMPVDPRDRPKPGGAMSAAGGCGAGPDAVADHARDCWVWRHAAATRETGSELRAGLTTWIDYDNAGHPHSTLAGRTPDEAYGAEGVQKLAPDDNQDRAQPSRQTVRRMGVSHPTHAGHKAGHIAGLIVAFSSEYQ
jgi:hypothetical protein